MVGKLPYEKTIGGTIYVCLVIPPALLPFAAGKKNVHRPIGSSRQDAKRNHAPALTSTQDEMDEHRRKKARPEGVAVRKAAGRHATMTPDQIARDVYRTQVAFADELRRD